ncbi:Response regulator receiver domain-containing protein [Reichenbachiella faecimaris]|uniref:Response regulator receiver domain-containing protein n=1 Tax=Reichenbachiella faecimaris TaxID=692418 RepID=A0A1W2GH50_REIFA|nr:response regulator transcription factor [Reichenbachiella faecimaris]SMD35993.1 Response regulator receiver domain-containing protein [Reichenbachiella faecimaris]
MKKILVCEDDEALISMIRFKLSKDNYGEVVKVTDGKSAMHKILHEDFDLIITDIHMPYFSGLELVTFVREKLGNKVPIIVLSLEGIENTVTEAFQLGADDFISKPFSPNELSMRVKRLLTAS